MEMMEVVMVEMEVEVVEVEMVEVMEMEVMEARLIRAAEINGEVDDDDAGTSGVEEGGGGLNGTPWCLPIPGKSHTLSSLVSPLQAVAVPKNSK